MHERESFVGLPPGDGVKRLTCVFEGAQGRLRKRISSGIPSSHGDFPTFQERERRDGFLQFFLVMS